MQVLGKSGHQCSCDIWSAGVIMYILLVGYPPFGGSTDHAILRRVRKGQYTFTGPNWDSVSEDAKHCIKRMLLMKPGSRATASQLLEEKWFKHAGAVSDQVTHHICTLTVPLVTASLTRWFTSFCNAYISQQGNKSASPIKAHAFVVKTGPGLMVSCAVMMAICSGRWILPSFCFTDSFNKPFTYKESCALVLQDAHALKSILHSSDTVSSWQAVDHACCKCQLASRFSSAVCISRMSPHMLYWMSVALSDLCRPDMLPHLSITAHDLQAFGQHMMKRLQGFAAMSQLKRLALLLLARTFTDKDVMRLKVWTPPPGQLPPPLLPV